MNAAGLSRKQILVMSATAGTCVANIYYNQPLLHDISLSYHTQDSSAGIIAVLGQAGYGLGLFFITPLGDKIDRKKLILILQILLVAALLGMSLANNMFVAGSMSLVIGIMSAAAQIVLPMSASLSPQNKGKIVGTVFTGLLTGVLTARVFSGYVAEWFNWRYVYGISAVIVTISAIIYNLILPSDHAEFSGNYIQLLGSALKQIKRFALLRQTALLGALVFGIFCSFWTTLTFHLSIEPFYYSSDTIGMFGLLAIAGIMVAPVFGKLVDKGSFIKSLILSTLLIITSVVCLQFFPNNLWTLVVAVLLLDVGAQISQVTNIVLIYTLDEKANSRINTIYMTCYFIGGSLGTFVGIQFWNFGGWHGVIWQLLLWSAMAFSLVFYRYTKSLSLNIEKK